MSIQWATDIVLPAGSEPSARRFTTSTIQSAAEMYADVFPDMEVVGWYTTGDTPQKRHVEYQRVLEEVAPAAIMLQVHAQPDESGPPASPHAHTDADTMVPVAAYTGGYHDTVLGQGLVKLPVRYTASESEQAVLQSASTLLIGASETDPTVSHLMSMSVSVTALAKRVKQMQAYVQAVAAGEVKPDAETLRSISTILANLPADDDAQVASALQADMIDTSALALAASLASTARAWVDATGAATAGHRYKEMTASASYT